MTLQPHLTNFARSLPAHARTPLADIDWVLTETGYPVDLVYELVDEGKYIWVWDIATTFHNSEHKRELRFLVDEIKPPTTEHAIHALTLDQVIGSLLPKHGDWFHGSSFCRLMGGIRRPTLAALAPELQAVKRDGSYRIPRAALIQFLSGPRWQGGSPSVSPVPSVVKPL